MCVLSRIGWCHKGFFMPKDLPQAILILLYNVTLFMIFSWLYVTFFMCGIVPLYSDLFCFGVWLRSVSWVSLHLGGAELDCYGTGFLGTNYCIPKRWSMGPLQLSLPPWLKPLVTPLSVGRRKVLTISQVLPSTANLLPKDLRFEHGGAKLVSCPGRYLT